MAGRSTVAFRLAGTLAALALAGCGGSSTHTTTAGPGAAAAERQFIAAAKAICAQAGEQQKPLKARKEALRGEPTAQATPAFASLADRAAAIARRADARLAALPRPPADAQTIAQLVHAYALEATDAGEIASAVADKDGNLGEAASEALARLVRQNQAAAERLGMGSCFALE